MLKKHESSRAVAAEPVSAAKAGQRLGAPALAPPFMGVHRVPTWHVATAGTLIQAFLIGDLRGSCRLRLAGRHPGPRVARPHDCGGLHLHGGPTPRVLARSLQSGSAHRLEVRPVVITPADRPATSSCTTGEIRLGRIGVASLARVVTPPPWLALGLPGSIRALSRQPLFPARGGQSHLPRHSHDGRRRHGDRRRRGPAPERAIQVSRGIPGLLGGCIVRSCHGLSGGREHVMYSSIVPFPATAPRMSSGTW